MLTRVNSFETLETMPMAQSVGSIATQVAQLLETKTTDQHLVDVKNALQDLKLVVQEEGYAARAADKMRRLEFALQNTSLVTKDCNFRLAQLVTGTQYKEYKYTTSPVDSDELLKDILLSFRKGSGHVIDLYYIDLSKGGSADLNEVKREWTEAFRNKLCDKLDRLLGSYPRFDFRNNGRVVIYYS